MNNDAAQSAQLIASLLEKLPQTEAEVIIAPSFVNLALAAEKTQGSPIIVAAQNMHFAEKPSPERYPPLCSRLSG